MTVKITVANIREAGPEKVREYLRKNPSWAMDIVENDDTRAFIFGNDSRNRDSHLVRMALNRNNLLAIQIIRREEIREKKCPGNVTLAQLAIENSPEARMEAIKIRAVCLIPATSPDRFAKYLVHLMVKDPSCAKYALESDSLCSIENKNGGSLEDYIMRYHKHRHLFLPIRGEKPQPEMTWGPNGSMHY